MGGLHMHIENEVRRLLGPASALHSSPGMHAPLTPQQVPRSNKGMPARWMHDTAMPHSQGPQESAVSSLRAPLLFYRLH